MKLAIVGFGNHVIKNILPALKKIENIQIEAIYVRDIEKYQNKAQENQVKLASVDKLGNMTADWVYISTPISTHYTFAKQALMLNKNVICEKPLTESVEKSQELQELAKSQNCILHEVCMYLHHRQYQYLAELVATNKPKIKSVTARFTIPHLDKEDIRYNEELAGGALLDVGYYPISIMINLFGKPSSIQSIKHSEAEYKVDLSGCAILNYDDFYCIAEWGIGLPYSNELTLVLAEEKYQFNRIFSKPASLNTTVDVFSGFKHQVIEIGNDDQFKNMLGSFIKKSEYSSNFIDIIKIISKL
jgi:NDP-hexose-3-ketoreductase